MRTAAIILPYFGKFNNYFQLFLDSFSFNKNFDLLIYTDQNLNDYRLSDNIIVKNISFDNFTKLIQDKFDFNIKLDRPYKLCDFKPTYGYVLENELSDYLYWGHCDCDLIFGDLTPVEELLKKQNYLKVFSSGHLTFYKNTFENNRIFMRDNIYRDAFKLSSIYGFDEGGSNCYGENKSIHSIYFNYFPPLVYSNDLCFNVSTLFYNFKRAKFIEKIDDWKTENSAYLFWRDGHLFSESKKKLEEHIYAHFSGRSFLIFGNINHYKNIYIHPDKFLLSEEFNIKKARKKVYNYRAFIVWLKGVKYRIQCKMRRKK